MKRVLTPLACVATIALTAACSASTNGTTESGARTATNAATNGTASNTPWFTTLRVDHSSWGITRSWWTLNADGSGEVATEKEPARSFQDFDLEVRRIQLLPDKLARVAALVRGMQNDGFDCEVYITDQMSTVLRWVGGGQNGEIVTYAGCTPESSRVRYPAIEELENIINIAAMRQPIVRTIPNRQPTAAAATSNP